MVCCRNVQLMPALFLKLTKIHVYGNGKTANSSISTIPLKFEDVLARNAFEYLQMIYIIDLHFAADSRPMVYIH